MCISFCVEINDHFSPGYLLGHTVNLSFARLFYKISFIYFGYFFLQCLKVLIVLHTYQHLGLSFPLPESNSIQEVLFVISICTSLQNLHYWTFSIHFFAILSCFVEVFGIFLNVTFFSIACFLILRVFNIVWLLLDTCFENISHPWPKGRQNLVY